ncbi:hypothetical protein [Arcobacter sp.]|uniref:hypothetical protein n=1 Tax=Arcobacter sp. TaxID=1872629 RepID=UPI003D139559
MIVKIWNYYIKWLLKYLDTDSGLNKYKFTLMEILHIGIAFCICFIIFYFIVGSNWILMIFGVSIGYGRIFLDQVLKKYDKNHPYDKRYTPFLRFIAYSSILFVTIGGTYILIKDAYENNTNVQKFIQNEVLPEVQKDIEREKNANN